MDPGVEHHIADCTGRDDLAPKGRVGQGAIDVDTATLDSGDRTVSSFSLPRVRWGISGF